ncbi:MULTISPECIES: hypothetical protein [Micromonospora]|uniref:hypothetical protein n=1 Tax=Micromonospora TaxID=1873 RepID=UPI0003EEAC1E|nr:MULTISPECIES: hypothetical protein [unclassified Micromonospora]EWM68052.1 LigA protein [Micromonospora sp. M42]MCK1808984.1 hypothetical protein [Micromonospora sp. R42106]MCK1833523.1 hypothetical protein [Micromonospora sp. R42003]MCK1845515.1 hypothetical protein [Micromonospora sp. R42004]MCM1015915.1 hypothetical protein [Micromonospora sp. XM-20-01]
MRHRLRHVAVVLLGAVLLGTVGLAAGSWYGGRGAAPVSLDKAQSAARELLPGTEPIGSLTALGYRYGVALAADDLGGNQVELQYGGGTDCALSERLRAVAETRGWREFRDVPGSRCDGWRAERDGMALTLTHLAAGPRLSMEPAVPRGFLAATITGALLGAAAGAALFWLLARRQPRVPRLVGVLVTVALLPGAAMTWTDLATDGLAEPVWPLWQALAPALVPAALVLLLVVVIVLAKRQKPAAAPAADAKPAARAGSPGAG